MESEHTPSAASITKRAAHILSIQMWVGGSLQFLWMVLQWMGHDPKPHLFASGAILFVAGYLGSWWLGRLWGFTMFGTNWFGWKLGSAKPPAAPSDPAQRHGDC